MSQGDVIDRLGELDNHVAFFPGVPLAHRENIQDALLYAHLRASSTADFQHSWHDWISRYRAHLERLGFQPHGVVSGHSEMISSVDDLRLASFRIDNVSVRARLAERVRDCFAASGVMQLAEQFFAGASLSAQNGSFQIMPCEMTDSGELMTLLCSLRLNDDTHSAGARRLIFYFKGNAYRFDPDLYAPHRQAVLSYLQGKTRAFITRVDL